VAYAKDGRFWELVSKAGEVVGGVQAGRPAPTTSTRLPVGAASTGALDGRGVEHLPRFVAMQECIHLARFGLVDPIAGVGS
jgi:hypothetical protein